MPAPLPTLLSQVLVAFVIEFDNEFEHRAPHRTTMAGGPGPWLASMAMWSTCMRFVGDEGISLSELQRVARTPTNLDGMRRWGYVTIDGRTDRSAAKNARGTSILRPTVKGAMARQVWQPLFGVIEDRWKVRFGGGNIATLREDLTTILRTCDLDLPDCMPILGPGLWTRPKRIARAENAGLTDDAPLSTLLSKVLLWFAVEFESESEFSLAICANVLRVLSGSSSPKPEIPIRSGVSKESIAMAEGVLKKQGSIAIEPGRPATMRLTDAGTRHREQYLRRLAAVEERWKADLGGPAIDSLRSSLDKLAGDGTRNASRLFEGLEPHPEGWRAKVPRPEVLPHFPMVLHRGGYPDGS